MKNKEQKFLLRYDVEAHPNGVAKSEVLKRGGGWTDAILIASVVYPPDGSLSIAFLTKDGRTDKNMEPLEMFKVWALLAASLAEMEGLGQAKRSLCLSVHEAVKSAVLKARKKGIQKTEESK